MYFSNRHGPLTIIPQIIFPSTILFSIIGLPYLRTRCHPIEANSKMVVYFIFHPQLNTHIFNDFNNAIIKMKYHGLRGSSNDFFIAFGQTKVKNHEKEHCRNNNAQLAPQIVSSICFSRRQIISLISNDHQRQQSNKKQATLRVVFSITICVLTFLFQPHFYQGRSLH